MCSRRCTVLWCTEVPEDAVLAVLIAELAIERSSLMTDQQSGSGTPENLFDLAGDKGTGGSPQDAEEDQVSNSSQPSGEELRRTKDDEKLTIGQMAEKWNVNRSTISRWISQAGLAQTRKTSKMSTKIRKTSRKKIRKTSRKKICEAVQQKLTQREMASQWRVSVAIVRKWLRETPGSGYILGKRGQSARPSASVEQAGPREMPVDIKTAFSGIKEQRISLVEYIERIGEEFATAQKRLVQYDKEVLEGVEEVGIKIPTTTE